MVTEAAADTSPAHIASRGETRTTAVLVAFGAVLSALTISTNPGFTFESIWGRDFASFYGSAEALLEGGHPYRPADVFGAVNVNLPHTIALLLPLTFVPVAYAFAAWQAIQLSAWGALLRTLFAGRAARPGPEFIAAAILFPGTLAQIALGQWAFALAFLVGLAWSAHCRGAELRVGLWIGIAASIKPFVGLLAVALLRRGRFRAAGVAFGVMAVALATGLVLLGPGLYRQWFDALQGITWGGYPLNASLQGLAERTLPEALIAPFWGVASSIVVGTTLLLIGECADESAAWTLVMVAALLVSPLGWLYYGWILVPSLFSLQRWSALLKAGLMLLWVPPGLLPALSTATVGLLMLWVAVAVDIRRSC